MTSDNGTGQQGSVGNQSFGCKPGSRPTSRGKADRCSSMGWSWGSVTGYPRDTLWPVTQASLFLNSEQPTRSAQQRWGRCSGGREGQTGVKRPEGGCREGQKGEETKYVLMTSSPLRQPVPGCRPLPPGSIITALNWGSDMRLPAPPSFNAQSAQLPQIMKMS